MPELTKRLIALPFLCLLLLPITGSAGKDPLAGYSFEKVTERTWVIHGPLEEPNTGNGGFMNNPGIVVTDQGVVVIDPGSSKQAGEMVLRELKKVSDRPVVAVFNSHIHGDHWLGNDAIREAYPDAKIYGHPHMIKAIANGEGDNWVSLMSRLTEGFTDGTDIVAPDNEANNSDIHTIGGITFKVHHFGQAHTDSDIMIEVVEDRTIFLGDNVLIGRVPSNVTHSSFKGNIASIDTILETGAEHWIPGHGKTSSADAVKTYRAYLATVYQTAHKVFNDDLDSSEVKKPLLKASEDYKGWAGYDDYIGKHGIQAYMEVEATEF